MHSVGILYDRYLHLVYGVCLKYLGERERSKDATMAVFEKITEALKEQEVQYFKSWLYIVSKNYCLMQLRKSKKELKISEDFVETNLVEHLEDEDANRIDRDLTALEKCMKTLKKDQEQCVRLFYLDSKSYVEIEEITSFSLKKVKSHIQNGKRNLRICIERHHE
ncbi:MAG: sigma-70 family RNA polymerase sigma factor [Cyclobacteriaceae bacterium]|nr:sigma-70 family RNA polymerase sigma factor [Cyclobacteriaceae bacterium HetDA_MAG_MS6]